MANRRPGGEQERHMSTKQPFTIHITDEVLSDLRERLTRTRWAEDFANDEWAYGTNGAYLRELVAYWIEHYDWRRHEAAINAFSHYRTTIEGIPIHFIHEPGTGPQPMPIILNHGWPWTFWDLNKVIRPLADPAAFGADPADSFGRGRAVSAWLWLFLTARRARHQLLADGRPVGQPDARTCWATTALRLRAATGGGGDCRPARPQVLPTAVIWRAYPRHDRPSTPFSRAPDGYARPGPVRSRRRGLV